MSDKLKVMQEPLDLAMSMFLNKEEFAKAKAQANAMLDQVVTNHKSPPPANLNSFKL